MSTFEQKKNNNNNKTTSIITITNDKKDKTASGIVVISFVVHKELTKMPQSSLQLYWYTHTYALRMLTAESRREHLQRSVYKKKNMRYVSVCEHM